MKPMIKKLLVVLALSIPILLVPLQFMGAVCSVNAELVDLSLLGSDINIYYLEGLPQRVRGLIERVGLGRAVVELRASEIPSSGLIVAHAGNLARRASHYTEYMSMLFARCKRCAVAVINMDPKADSSTVFDAYSVVLKGLGGIGIAPLLPLSPEQPTENDKLGIGLLHPSLLTADIVVFSSSPPGVIVVESVNHYDFHYVLSAILEWSGVAGYEKIPEKARIRHNTIVSGPTNMVLIGYIGWISGNTYGRDCGEVTGRQFVYVRYYYGNTTSVAGTLYHVWYVHVQHSGVGYKTRCCRWMIFCSDYNHYPRLFDTVIHWRTDTWPGQVLDDWSPKNVGSARTITYTMSAGISAGAKDMAVKVEYSTGFTEPNAPYFRWENYGMNPAEGLVRVRHWVERGGYMEGQMNNLVFTVEPSSFGFLDPNKPGGLQPMIIRQSFYMELNTGDNINVTISVSLYSSRLSWGYIS